MPDMPRSGRIRTIVPSTCRKSRLEKYAEDFRTVYNKAWVKHGAGKNWNPSRSGLFPKDETVIDELAIWYVYYKE